MRRRDDDVIRERRRQLGSECGSEGLGKLPENLSIIMAGMAGLSGTKKLLDKHKNELEEHFSSAFLRTAAERTAEGSYSLPELPAAVFPLGKGGVLEGLWILSRELFCGLEADLRAVPVLQDTIEICEFFGIDPYAMPSEGAFLIVTARERFVMESLRTEGIPAGVTGTVSEGADCILTCDGRIRYLNRP